MKKLLFLIIFTLCFTACGKKVEQGEDGGITASIETEEGEILFSQNDFGFYYPFEEKENGGSVIMGLGMAESSLGKGQTAQAYMEGFRYETKKESVYTSLGDGSEPKEEELIYYISYMGGTKPVYTYKNISTTGFLSTEDTNCSKAEDVIKAYGIDTEKEEYKEDVKDENNYNIVLLFNRNVTSNAVEEDGENNLARVNKAVTRKITQKGESINQQGIYAKMRFAVKDGYVHGIDIYCMGE